MSSEIPKVLVLGPITPSSESVRSEQLAYDKLEPAVDKHRPYEYQRMDQFWSATEGSLEEQEAAKQLAQQYMLMGAAALQRVVKAEDKDLWSQRYTQATGELYGAPLPETAQVLENNFEADTSFEKTAKVLHEYLDAKYAPVFETLNVEDGEELPPATVADKFKEAIQTLAEHYDSDWSEWVVERNEDKDSLSVVAGSKKIIVGMNRAAMKPGQLKPLFTHEVLVHAQRGLNGAKLSKQLQTGLPDYLDVEEGLGVFFEYALTGSIPEKNIDRYTDIAYALGQLDGRQHTRQEMIERAMARAQKRNEAAELKKSDETITREVYAHVNRIYRGSLGNEHIGVFTKDIAYHAGFLKAGSYIQSELEAGKDIEEIVDYLFQGKFDPTNAKHVEFLTTAKSA